MSARLDGRRAVAMMQVGIAAGIVYVSRAAGVAPVSEADIAQRPPKYGDQGPHGGAWRRGARTRRRRGAWRGWRSARAGATRIERPNEARQMLCRRRWTSECTHARTLPLQRCAISRDKRAASARVRATW